eukprot:6488137-Amphidinium_carterae.2
MSGRAGASRWPRCSEAYQPKHIAQDACDAGGCAGLLGEVHITSAFVEHLDIDGVIGVHCRVRVRLHQRGGLTKQSITQIDYAFIKGDNDKHNATVLTICESTTGLGYATVVDYKGLHPRAIKAIMRFLVAMRTDYRARFYSQMARMRSLNY